MSLYQFPFMSSEPISCKRNVCNLLPSTSTDYCIFNNPVSNISATTLISNVIDSGSTGVYNIANSATTIDFDFSFTGFTSAITSFNYNIYKFDNNNNLFNPNPILVSSGVSYSAISATSSITQSILINNLYIDGEYIFLNNYLAPCCTTYLGLLGYNINTGSYRSVNDYTISGTNSYFIATREADKPTFNNSTIQNTIGSLYSFSFFGSEGVSSYTISITFQGDFFVSLNGLSLSKDNDYEYVTSAETNNLLFAEPLKSTDIITIIGSINGNNGLRQETININTSIPSGSSNNQSSNILYYYNTTENKYEIYTEISFTNNNDLIVSLNGVILSNNIDYYKSTTNDKRIILNGGPLQINDIINIYYLPSTYNGNIYTNTLNISWNILNAPQKVNGYFVTQVANSEIFDNASIISSATTNYSPNYNNYSTQIIISGNIGDILYYRVKNYKNYVCINGNTISTSSISDVIPITIMSNAINSY